MTSQKTDTKLKMLYDVNKGRLAYIDTRIKCGLDTLLNMLFKCIFKSYAEFEEDRSEWVRIIRCD
jgi:hypothetical protein